MSHSVLGVVVLLSNQSLIMNHSVLGVVVLLSNQ
jgi:hypothetical protein